MYKTLILFTFLGTALLSVLPTSATPPPRQPKKTPPAPIISYSYQNVESILQRSCVGCHNAKSPASGLDVSTYEALIKGGNGGATIVPGSSTNSLLYKYLIGKMQPIMPMGGSLKPSETAIIKRWIDSGAFASRARKAAAETAMGFGKVDTNIAPPVTALAFSSDNKTLLVGTYRQVQCWDISTGKRTRILLGPSESVYALAVSPDGKMLAVGGGVPTLFGETLLYDLKTGKISRTLKEHKDIVFGVDFTPDGKSLITASGDKTLRIWSLATGESQKPMKEHADSVYAVRCTKDGSRFISTGVDRSIKVWDVATRKPLFSFTGIIHGDTAYTLAFSPDGARMLSASGDHSAKLWTLGSDSEHSREFRKMELHSKAVHSAVYSADGMFIATASADRTVNLWSGLDGGWLRTLEGAKDWVYAVVFTPDNQHVIAGAYDGELRIWRVADGLPEARFSTLPSTTRLTSLYPSRTTPKKEQKLHEPIKVADGFAFPEGPAYDGKGNVFVSNCNADYVSKLDVSGKSLAFKHADDRFTFEKTNGMTFYQDGSLFVCDFGRNAILLIRPDGTTEMYADKWEDKGFKGPNDLAFDPEGNLYFSDPAGSDAKNSIGCVYRVAKGTRRVAKVAEGMAFPNGVAFSADAKYLYIAESYTFRILRAKVKPDGTLEKPELFCQMPKDHVPDGMNFDQAGNLYVATVGPGLVTIIDKEGKITRTIKLPGTDVTNVEFAGKDLKTLYITEAQKGEVYKLNTEIGGLPLFRAPQNEAK